MPASASVATVFPKLENLYKSLYDDDSDCNDATNAFNIELIQIEKISGHQDINCLSKYYNLDEYTLATNSLDENNYLNITYK